MCLQPATPARPAARRYCSWVYDATTTRRLLEDGVPAPLTVVTERGSWTYLCVLRNDGVWEMSHTAADNSGSETYEVDVDNATCSCPHYTHKHPCKKHVPSLRAALSRLAGKAVAS